MTAETYVPRTAIENSEEKKTKLSLRARIPIFLGAAALGVMAGRGIAATGFHFNKIESNEANVEAYRTGLEAIVHADAWVEGEMNPSTTVTFESDGSRHAYTVDDDPTTHYADTAPNYIQALNDIDPLLLDAAEVTRVKLVDAPDDAAAYVSNIHPHTIYLDKEYAVATDPVDIGRTLRHESIHHIQLKAAPVPMRASLPAFANENPADFHYYDALSLGDKASYDLYENGYRVSVSEYASTSEMEDIAEYGSVMTAPDTGEIDAWSQYYLDKVKNGDELTLDKTAVMLDMMDQADPRLGRAVLDNIENHLDDHE